MDPNLTDLYAGLAGVEFREDEFDFGQGIVLSKTYAHLMAPFLMAFARAEPGRPHPAPWKPASGGFGFDIEAELFVPGNAKVPDWFDNVNTVWWIAALLRLKANPLLCVP